VLYKPSFFAPPLARRCPYRTKASRCGAETNRPRVLKSQAHSKAARGVLQHTNVEPAVKFANPSALLLNFIALNFITADIFAGRAALNFSAKFNACRDSKALKTHNARNFSAIFDAEARF
jgi:hypothetical protein